LDKNIDPTGKTAAIHIRNTDYLGSVFDWFDRKKYIDDSIAWMLKDHHDVDHIVVFSDDIDLCKRQFGSTISEKFSKVTYLDDNESPDAMATLKDFLRLSLFKHKIIFNSSFSAFAAYVGNVLYPSSFDCVYAPAFDFQDRFSDRNNYLWNLVLQQPK